MRIKIVKDLLIEQNETLENLIIFAERAQCLLKLFHSAELTNYERKIIFSFINEIIYNIRVEAINSF